jgi:Family of unknown function (DUF5678)
MKASTLPIIDLEKYGGQQVAIVQGKIVASARDTQTLMQEVTRQIPGITWQDIILVSVPASLPVIYSVT